MSNIGAKVRKLIWRAVVVLMLSACGAKELKPITLKFNWLHGTNFVGFYVAQVNGYYAEEGLDVTLIELGDVQEFETNAAQVEQREIDFGIGAFDLVNAQTNGKKLTAIANFYKFSPATFFARTDTGIQTPADLEGFSVAVKGKPWENLLIRFLDQGNLTLDDVVAVESGFDMTPFFEGEVDVWAGYLTDEAVHARMAGLDIITLPLYEYGISEYAVTIYTSHEMLEDPETVEGFIRATVRGWQWAINNSSEAIDIMLELHPELDEDPDFYLASFEASIPLMIPSGVALGSIDCEGWMDNEGLVELSPTEDYCDEQYFEAATE